jgi:hypothetical protein
MHSSIASLSSMDGAQYRSSSVEDSYTSIQRIGYLTRRALITVPNKLKSRSIVGESQLVATLARRMLTRNAKAALMELSTPAPALGQPFRYGRT